MKLIVSAQARATVANQPSYDQGGFPILPLKTLAGVEEEWETLFDQITLCVELPQNPTKDISINITNEVHEKNVPLLPTDSKQNTAGIIIEKAIEYIKGQGIPWPYTVNIAIKKGLSIKGTGLGSSGASSAAALKAFEKILSQLKLPSLPQKIKIDLLCLGDQGVPDNSIPAYFGKLVFIEQNKKNSSLSIQQFSPSPNFGYFVLCTPQTFGLNTQKAREVLQDITIPKQKSQIEEMLSALTQGDIVKYGSLLEEVHKWFVSPRQTLYPQQGKVYQAVYQAAKSNGATGVTISGAGPTILALVPGTKVGQEVGKSMHQAFAQFNFPSVARLVDIDRAGAF